MVRPVDGRLLNGGSPLNVERGRPLLAPSEAVRLVRCPPPSLWKFRVAVRGADKGRGIGDRMRSRTRLGDGPNSLAIVAPLLIPTLSLTRSRLELVTNFLLDELDADLSLALFDKFQFANQAMPSRSFLVGMWAP